MRPRAVLICNSSGTEKLIVLHGLVVGSKRTGCLDTLEGSLALNLIVLGVATYYTKLLEGDQLTVGHTSVSI